MIDISKFWNCYTQLMARQDLLATPVKLLSINICSPSLRFLRGLQQSHRIVQQSIVAKGRDFRGNNPQMTSRHDQRDRAGVHFEYTNDHRRAERPDNPAWHPQQVLAFAVLAVIFLVPNSLMALTDARHKSHPTSEDHSLQIFFHPAHQS